MIHIGHYTNYGLGLGLGAGSLLRRPIQAYSSQAMHPLHVPTIIIIAGLCNYQNHLQAANHRPTNSYLEQEQLL